MTVIPQEYTRSINDLFAEGYSLHQQGKLAEAYASYQSVVAIDPLHFDAIHMSGVVALQTGNYPAAFDLLKRSIQLQPDSDAAHINLALVLQACSRTDLALQCLQRAIELNPENTTAWNNLGNLLQDNGQLTDAIECFDKAIEKAPQYTDAYNNRGNAYLKLQRHEEACKSFNSALALDPDLASAHYGLGLTLLEEKQFDRAIASLQKTVALNPRHADAHFHIGLIHHECREFELAIKTYDLAYSLNPNIDYLLGYRIYAKSALCDWSNRNTEIDTLINGIQSGKKVAPPFFYLALLDAPDIHLAAARTIISGLPLHERQAKKDSPNSTMSLARTDKRIRIGYLSSDFCLHAVGLLSVELFELHNRDQFDIYGFCWSKEDGSSLRERIKKAFDHYVPIGHLSDKQAAEVIDSFDIDILIDLQGMTSGARPNLLLQRPAGAFQVSYLGMPGTTGLSTMDYILGDPQVFPPELEPYMSEKPLRVPRCFQISDRKRDTALPVTRASCGLPEEKFIFAAFNNNYKITPEMFSCWMRILNEVPDSVLWLTTDYKQVEHNLTQQASAQGVDPARLIFCGRTQPAEYMARLAVPDLFLDTFPYNAGTTANDILWMGTPILTYSGQSYASRMCGSLLWAAGLPELICQSLEEYKNKAINLGRNSDIIKQYKQHLSSSSLDLFDIPNLVKDLEDAFLNICR